MDSIIFVMFAAIVIIGLGFLVIITLTRKGPRGLNQEKFRSRWLAIEGSLGESESSRHLCILNADKLLDEALKARGFRGQTMGERLKSARKTLRNNNAVWAAHKLRNQIAHESDISIKPQTARQALAAFKGGLKDVGAL